MLCKVTHCTGYVTVNTDPHQQCWGDHKMSNKRIHVSISLLSCKMQCISTQSEFTLCRQVSKCLVTSWFTIYLCTITTSLVHICLYGIGNGHFRLVHFEWSAVVTSHLHVDAKYAHLYLTADLWKSMPFDAAD